MTLEVYLDCKLVAVFPDHAPGPESAGAIFMKATVDWGLRRKAVMKGTHADDHFSPTPKPN